MDNKYISWSIIIFVFILAKCFQILSLNDKYSIKEKMKKLCIS